MTDALRKELPRMLEEHKRIRAATEKSWRAHRSAGPNQLAIAHSGEDAVRFYTELRIVVTRWL